MNGDGFRTCAPVKSIKTSQQVFIGFKNLPAGFLSGIKNLWPKYVLKWALGNRNLHKKFNERYEQVLLFFSFFETLFYTKLPFPLLWLSKDLLVENLQVANFEIHHEFGLHLAIDQHPVCPNLAPAWTLTLEMISFEFWVEIHDAEHVDRCSCKYTRVWSYQLTSEMFTFLDMLALVVSESNFGAYVCLRRPARLHRNERSC